MTKRLVLFATAIMTTVLALAAVWQFRIVVLYVLVSLVLAATLRPISKSETRHSLATRFRLIVQYVLFLGFAILIIFLVGRFIITDIQQLADTLAQQTEWMIPAWLEGTLVQQALVTRLPAPNELLEQLSSQPMLVLSAILGFTESLGGLVGGFVVTLLLSVYWSINQNHFERLWLSLLPVNVRKRARYIGRTIEQELGAYTRSEILQSLLAGVILGIGYWLLGSPYPGLLAVAGAILRLIPVAGSILALLPPLLLGLLSSTEVGWTTVLYTMFVLTFLEVWVEPRLFRLKSDNQVLTFVILLAMTDAFGLLGIIVAPPLSVICQILWRMFVSERLAPESTLRISDLRKQQTHLQEAIEKMEDPPPPLVASSMERLAGLLEKAEPILRTVRIEKPPDRLRPPG